MKKIAVITGASSGMGSWFVKTIESFGEPLDEVWVIARREERLKALTAPYPIRPIAMDLTDRASFDRYRTMLEEEQPDVRLLVNASGFGIFDATIEAPLERNLSMVDLNCQAVLAMCQLSVPYMHEGAKILNISSVAAYQPIPYINIYAATKTFVMYYSRALNRELKMWGISVMALCPFWTRTEFFDHAIRTKEAPVVKKYVAMYEPEQVVRRAWRELKRGKDCCQYGFVSKFQTFLAKILPHSFVMSYWMHQQHMNGPNS